MTLKILALNLCASWNRPRAERLQMVADFVQANEVDVLLVQEGVRSCFVYDTIRQLADDLYFNYFAKSVFGFPLFWEFRVGVISRYPIIRTASLNAEVPQKEWLDAIPLPWRRRAAAATVDVPGLGITTLVSVHLTSSPKSEFSRQCQFFKLRHWIDCLPPSDCRIIGGDFNTAQDNPAFEVTFGGMAIAGDPPDYICVDGGRIVKASTVFTDRVVSDHAGVLAQVERGSNVT
jgi:endonuclease/exonuclease/phosphatase family metal-dependent hydrolase